jgi:hypothetical protein
VSVPGPIGHRPSPVAAALPFRLPHARLAGTSVPLAGPLTKLISWVALLIWADSPVVRYRHAIAVGLETVQVFTVVTLSGRRVRSARYQPASEMLSRCAMSAGGVERGWAHGDPS